MSTSRHRSVHSHLLALVLVVVAVAVFARTSLIGEDSRARAEATPRQRSTPSAAPAARPTQPHYVRFSSRKKQGLTILGIQPGDSFDRLVAELPPSCSLERRQLVTNRPEKRLVLTDPSQQDLVLSTRGEGEDKIITGVWCMGPGPGFTIERDGEILVQGRRAEGDFHKAFPDFRGRVVEDGLMLTAEFTSNGLFAVGLRLQTQKGR